MAKILVVDDRVTERGLLVTLLKYALHDVIEAVHGDQALHLVKTEHPDLVISDVLLPEMDGYEFVRRLRTDPSIARTAVIFYTAVFNEHEARGLAEDIGVSRVLSKPTDPEKILNVVSEVLKARGTEVVSPLPPQFNDKHQQLLIEKLLRQVDALHQGEQALCESERLYRSIAQNFPGGAVYIFDRNLNFLVAEGQALESIGYSRRDLEGKSIYDLDQETCTMLEPRYKRVLAGHSLQFEDEFHERIFFSRYVPILNDHGEVIRGMVVAHDITERKKTEDSLRQSEKALRKAHDELEQRVLERTAELKERAGQLARLSSELTLAEKRERRRLAVMIHDHLQQLLAGAKIHLEILANQLSNGNPSFSSAYNLIVESLKTARSLSAQMAPYILYERGLAPGLEWLAQNIRETYGLSIEPQIDPDISVDREDVRVLLFESVRELLFNFVKHACASSAQIGMHRDDKGNLRITVSDQGVGFDPHKILNKASRDGCFGLFSIKERLELMGGNLEIESSPGHGAVFSLIVPMNKIAAEEESFEANRAGAEESFSDLSPMDRRIRVLLVDDHVVMRQGISAMLEKQSDIKVVGEAKDGEEAIQMARRLHPSVVLMDIKMPRMNGIEATKVIHSEFPYIRIIGLSMYEDAETIQAMLRAGAVTFTTKSGHSDALLTAIRGSA